VTLRAATTSDIPAMQACELAAGEMFRSVGMDAIADAEPFDDDELAAYIADGRAWVVVDGDDEPLGYAVAEVVDGLAHLEQLSVVPAAQGRGRGRALVDAVERWAVAHDLPAMTLTTFRDVPWNAPLYAHLGFEVLADPGPELIALVAHEAEMGLDPQLRVCMRRAVLLRR
jgi:GNAT superfamily N-acetyltransferase